MSRADLAHVYRVPVPLEPGPGVLVEGVLPGLGQGAVVADVAVPGEDVSQVPEMIHGDVDDDDYDDYDDDEHGSPVGGVGQHVDHLLLVLDDGVQGEVAADLELGLGPPGHHDTMSP